MKIAVLGTGPVGQAHAGRFADLTHEVVVGTRDPSATLRRTEPDTWGRPAFGTWAAEHPGVRVATYAEAAAFGEIVIIAVNGAGALAALTMAGAEALAGKVLIDVSNPLDFSAGMPATLFVKDTDSLGEQIQRTFPTARVVKTLNTLTAALQVDPAQLAHGEHTVFLSGDDGDAKRVVLDLLRSLGHTDVIDLGDITTARGTEMYLPLWLRLWPALGTPMLNIKVVR